MAMFPNKKSLPSVGDLEDAQLFDLLCEHKFGSSYKKGSFRYFAKGESIYFRDDAATSIYLVLRGKVRLINYADSGGEIVRAVLGQGEMFGEMAMLGHQKRHEIAEAMTDNTVVSQMQVSDVHQLILDNKDFAGRIYQWLGSRIQKMERKIDGLIYKDVRSRLIDFIIELASEKGVQVRKTVEVEYFFTHQNMANLIGTSRQTVTTTLNELREEGLIDFNRKKIIIKKPELLRSHSTS